MILDRRSPGIGQRVANVLQLPKLLDDDPGAPVILEFHVFDLRRKLYGRRLEVFFVERLRRERRFPNLEALAAQIGKDVSNARKSLRKGPGTKLWIRTLQVWYPDTIVPGEKKRERKEERV